MDYTFTNFVVGSSNQFAHAAALAVANLPAEAYNPLLLYGGTGLGKTHLLHAIAHRIRQHHPTWRVVYLPAESFMRELLQALHHERMDAFQEHYRQADVLLVDDLQFMAGRERTQEAFLHIFNALYEAKKQVVLSSDKPPQDIAPLAARLRSRYPGLMATCNRPIWARSPFSMKTLARHCPAPECGDAHRLARAYEHQRIRAVFSPHRDLCLAAHPEH
jgi:chromosomal replication initiator protein